MNSQPRTTPLAGRDPVCESIESLLRDLEAEGKGPLTITDNGGSAHAEAVNVDIALVRLAGVLMDDATYGPILIDALRGAMESAKA
jgi:hypothetical protein